MKAALIVLMAWALSACTYNATVNVAPAYDIYSNYDAKVAGKWAFYADATSYDNVEAIADGITCSAHTFKFSAGRPFVSSGLRTFSNLVEDIQEVQTPIPVAELPQKGFAGVIILKGENVKANFSVAPKFFSGTARADIDMTATLSVLGVSGRLLGTTASQSGTGRNETAACDGITKAVSDGTEEAIKRILVRLAERFANSPRVREFGAKPKVASK